MVEHPKPPKTTQGGGALHTIPRTPRHGWPVPKAPARGPPLRATLPPRPVPTIAPQLAPLPGVYLNTVTGAKGVYLTTRDTTGQAIPLDQVHHMALSHDYPSATNHGTHWRGTAHTTTGPWTKTPQVPTGRYYSSP